MKDLRCVKVIISMIGFFLLLPGVRNSCSIANLVFKIELEKDTYPVREAVWVDLYFTNKGDKIITLDCLDLPWQELTVNLVNSKGDTLRYGGYILDGICRAGPSINPTDTYHYSISLSENFGEGAKEHVPFSLRYFDEDSYTLQMIHTGVSSNLLKFKVKAPKGDEKRPCELLKKVTKKPSFYYKDYYKESQRIILLLQELIDNYPKSIYADLAYYELAGHYGRIGEPDKSHENLRKLIFNYPNSRFALKALPALLQQMTEDEKTKFLKEIIKNQPKTRASDWGQEFLEDLEEKEKPKK